MAVGAQLALFHTESQLLVGVLPIKRSAPCSLHNLDPGWATWKPPPAEMKVFSCFSSLFKYSAVLLALAEIFVCLMLDQSCTGRYCVHVLGGRLTTESV